MVSRRTSRILAIIGVIVVLVGILSAAYATFPSYASDTLPLPAGGDYYTYYSWSVLDGGSIQGNFSVLNGTPVEVFVYGSSDYNAYASGENLTGLYNTTAVSGELSMSVSGFDTYYIVFQHAPAYNSTEQDIAVNLTSTGIDPTFFLGGVVAAGVGVALLVFGIRRLRARRPSEAESMPPSTAYQGGPSMPPSGTDAASSGAGTLQVPPPLPGAGGGPSSPAGPPMAGGPAAQPGPTSTAQPIGTLLVTVENRSSSDESVQLLVNGVAAASLTVPAGTRQQASVPARLTSPFGSTVVVEAVTSRGQRAKQSVFVGARGTAPVALRLG